MKVVLINTFEMNGGAAVACNRLLNALEESGTIVQLITRDKSNQKREDVISVNSNFLKQKINFFRFVWERFTIFTANRFSKKNLFAVSLANTGNDLSKLEAVKEADIIHLHWINQGLLSIKDIKRLIDTGKPIVWTFHDLWPATGICHYPGDCTLFQTHCHDCPLLNRPSSKDFSYRIFEKKRNFFSERITGVGCSKWIAGVAKKSNLLAHNRIISIPNTIDTNLFSQKDKDLSRLKFNLPTDKKLILFGAAKLSDKRKGIDYFIEACTILQDNYPEVFKDLGIVLLGNSTEEITKLFPCPSYPLHFLSNPEDLSSAYSAVDLFVIPSLEDNLPNTIMEAMSCGTPCVGFDTGGIPEMIDHLINGYIARHKDSKDLASGIASLLSQNDTMSFEQRCREKVLAHYSHDVIAKKYNDLYQKLIDNTSKHGK